MLWELDDSEDCDDFVTLTETLEELLVWLTLPETLDELLVCEVLTEELLSEDLVMLAETLDELLVCETLAELELSELFVTLTLTELDDSDRHSTSSQSLNPTSVQSLNPTSGSIVNGPFWKSHLSRVSLGIFIVHRPSLTS